MKSWLIENDWQGRAADEFNKLFKDKNQEAISELRGLSLIPLCDSSWVTAASGPIYYPDVDGLRVPDGLGLQIVEPRALTVESRRVLFENLGVQRAPISMIRKKIGKKWTDPKASHMASELNLNITHLKFLYQTDHLEERDASGKKGYFVVLDDQTFIWSTNRSVYLKTADPYGPFELLRKTSPGKDRVTAHQGSRLVSCILYIFKILQTPPKGLNSLGTNGCMRRLALNAILRFSPSPVTACQNTLSILQSIDLRSLSSFFAMHGTTNAIMKL